MKKMPHNHRPPISSEKDEVLSHASTSKGVIGHDGQGMPQVRDTLETAPIHPVRSDKSEASSLAWFQYIEDSDGTLVLKSKFGEYITVLENKKMVARSAARGGSQSFLRIDNND